MKSNIENFKLQPLNEANFIMTALATYTQNGKNKSWEILQAHDSVAILIYHKELDAFVLVKQFRPAVYMNNQDGMSVELCAGIVDKKLSLLQIAQEEIEEECGYAVALENIEKITAFHTSVGFAGSKQTLYYAQIEESMKVSEGGGIDDEQIEVIYLPLKEAKDFMYDESIVKTSGLMFAFAWYFAKMNH
ncbi:MAG: NUDIX hydrolase [Epsilonproteobacteria bacterium]|nr:MAG: NUDIX hydrolase [Campylobacterota bacterium]